MANRKFYYNNKKNTQTKSKPSNKKQIIDERSKYDKSKLDLSLVDLGLCETTQQLLEKFDIHSAGDLVVRTDKDMYKVQGLNKKILFEVKDSLKKNKMSLMIEQTKPKAESKGAKNDKSISSKLGGSNKEKSNSKQRNTKNVTKEKLIEPLPINKWRKIQKNGKWGFYDGFKTVIPSMYDEVFCFKDDLASVELNEQCGYIDSKNNIVIPFDYESAMSFSEGLASVVKNGKCGYINKNNETILGFEFDAATPFENGEAKIKKDGKWGTITPDGVIKWI